MSKPLAGIQTKLEKLKLFEIQLEKVDENVFINEKSITTNRKNLEKLE